MGLILLLLFIGVPLIEIMLFIKVGGAIGMSMTIVIVVATALMGSFMLHTQRLATMREAQAHIDRAELPVDSVIHGIFLLLAGAFLLTPGFLTDTIGFALFVPSLRLALGRQIMAAVMARGSVNIHASSQSWQTRPGNGPRPGQDPANGQIIDGEATEVEDD